MWGIIPAAGQGTRIQPLAFSKELLPVGARDGETARPKAVSEYLVERMLVAGADKLCFVIAPGKTDIVEYYGSRLGDAQVCFAVQKDPIGLCDAIFQALPFIGPDEMALVGLPDTVWFPADGLAKLTDAGLSFLLFPVANPTVFDAVETDEHGNVREIQVKRPDATTHWIWGAFRMPGWILKDLHALWLERGREDQYFGTLVNAWLAKGNRATAVRAGETYLDVGTLEGYRAAIEVLATRPAANDPEPQSTSANT